MRKDIAYKEIIQKVKDKLNKDKLNIEQEMDFLNDFFTPDGFINTKDKIIIIEHSSTGDRKAHIGELLQAFTFMKVNSKDTILITVLDNDNENGPKKAIEQERLEYFLHSLKQDYQSHSFEVYVLDKNEVNTVTKLKKFILNLLEEREP